MLLNHCCMCCSHVVCLYQKNRPSRVGYECPHQKHIIYLLLVRALSAQLLAPDCDVVILSLSVEYQYQDLATLIEDRRLMIKVLVGSSGRFGKSQTTNIRLLVPDQNTDVVALTTNRARKLSVRRMPFGKAACVKHANHMRNISETQEQDTRLG